VQQYFQNNKKIPFIVHRRNWSNIYGILITSVKPRETSNGWFGDVFGYPLDGSSTKPYWGIAGKPNNIKIQAPINGVL
jgi:hypothetical protein